MSLNNNATAATIGAGTTQPSRAHDSSLAFEGLMLLNLFYLFRVFWTIVSMSLFCHCIVCSSIHGYYLPILYLYIVLDVIVWSLMNFLLLTKDYSNYPTISETMKWPRMKSREDTCRNDICSVYLRLSYTKGTT